MDLRCQLALDKSRCKLVEDLDIKRAADYLVSKSVLTWEDNERILLPNQTSFDQRRNLLAVLPQRGQDAFDTFCEFLRDNQDWLHDIVVEHRKSITEEEVINYRRSSPPDYPSRHELQEALTHKLYEFVQNDPSKILKNAEEGIYIEQSIRLETKTGSAEDKDSQQDEPSTNSILTLLSNATPGERMIVYGGAGMGKSTLCRKVVRTWADSNPEIRKRFDYIFPIPLRSLHSRSLIDIISRDVELIPESCKTRLQQELDINPTRLLFVLDSFEEITNKRDDNVINLLFRRELLPESTVLVTSRPNADIQRLQSKSKSCTAVHLQGLTINQTREYIKSYPKLKQDVCSLIEQNFGMGFLQCPLNLWLICNLLADKANAGQIELPETQTVLLNSFFQQIMLVYVRKKKLHEFTTSAKSPMEIEDAPEARSILSVLGRLCYTAIKDGSHVLKIGQEVLSIKDVLEVGLFTDGPEKNSVALPHPIFQEYMAALHLSSDKLARENVIRDIASELECSIEKRSLEDALSSLGLKETIRFLIGLLPATAKDFCNLFVIKQRIVKGVEGIGSAMQPDLQYELALLKECPDSDAKRVIAMAILNAPAVLDSRWRTDYVQNTGSYELLKYFTEEQCLLFLKKAYNIDSKAEELSLFVNASNKDAVFDNFAVGFSHLFAYSVQIPSLNIVHSHLPVQLLQENMAAVSRLNLFRCVLCEQSAQYRPLFNIAVKRMHKTRAKKDPAPLELLCLDNVLSLNSLSSLRPTLALNIFNHVEEPYDLAKLKALFGEVKELRLSCTDYVPSSKTRWSSVTDLIIGYGDDLDIALLSDNFPNVEDILVEHAVVRLPTAMTKWQAVRDFEMRHSFLYTYDAGYLDRLKALDELKHICPQAQLDMANYRELPAPGTEVVALFNFNGDPLEDLSFQKGDRLRIVNVTTDPMWSLARNRLGSEGMIPMNYVATHELPVPGTEVVALFNFKGDPLEDLSFRKGDRLRIVKVTGDPMWSFARNRLGSEGMIPMNYIATTKNVPLEPMLWYHGRLTRDDCWKRLSSSKVGTYLIKDNNNFPDDYTLCVRYDDNIRYYRIIAKDNKMTIDEKDYFSCLPRLVEHYGRVDGVLCTKLEQYVSVQGQPRVTVDEAAFLEKHWVIEVEDVELRGRMERGKPGDVFRGEYFGQSVLVERPKQTRQREGILVEAAVMTALQHQNVVKCIGVILGDTIQLVKEYLGQGSLHQYLSRKATEVTKEQQLKFARDICHGMIHLKEEGFLHRFLTAAHVWVHEDGTAKLFNLWQARPVGSNRIKSNQPPSSFPVGWASPEILQNGIFSTKSDMWSFGVVLWEIYTLGKEPYPSLEKGNVREMLQHLQQGHRLQIPTDCPPSVVDIMKEAWAAHPVDRPTFTAVEKRLAEDQTQGVTTESECTKM